MESNNKSTPSVEETLDTEYLANQTGGDPELTRLVLETALQEVPPSRRKIRQPADDQELANTAHLLKGMLGMLGGHRASKLSGRLEVAAKSGVSTEEMIRQLDDELDRLLDAVEQALLNQPLM